jgi:hypothetical protein
MGGRLVSEPEPELIVHKVTGYVVASEELLMDCGVIPDTRPPPPPTPWRVKLRRRVWAWRDAAATWAYRRISGHDVEPPDDYYD